jgi:uncharacterized protein YcbK (DUF882 family)
MLGLGVPWLSSSLARAAFEDERERRIWLRNLWTEEQLDVIYWRDGDYVPEVLADLSRLLRDRMTGESSKMFPRLFDLAFMLKQAFKIERPIGVVSGFRSRSTNEMLRQSGDGVSRNSLHMLGLAMDIRVEGVPSERLFTAVAALGIGGAGFYRETDFVHLDLGPVRIWGI